MRKALDYAVQIAQGPRRGAREGHRPPGPEAREPLRDQRRARQDPRLRPREADAGGGGSADRRRTCRRLRRHGARRRAGDARLHVAGAGAGASRPIARSDLFAFGAILYEMLSGPRAFQRRHGGRDDVGDPARGAAGPLGDEQERPRRARADRAALPREEPGGALPVGARPRVRPRGALGISAPARRRAPRAPSEAPRVLAPPSRRGARRRRSSLVAGVLRRRRDGRLARRRPSSQLTFRRGTVCRARFGSGRPDGLYYGGLGREATEIFVGRPESPESRRFGFAGAEVLAVSSSGRDGGLARGRLRAGSARPGRSRSVARRRAAPHGSPGGRRVRPTGRPTGRISRSSATSAGKDPARVSRSARSSTRRAGWVEQPAGLARRETGRLHRPPGANDDGGSSRSSTAPERRRRREAFATAQGLAWSPDGAEVWFTAAEVGGNRALYAVTLSGKTRVCARGSPGNLTLQDISRDGRVLDRRTTRQLGDRRVAPPGETKERELTGSTTRCRAASPPTGKIVLFTESGEGGGAGTRSTAEDRRIARGAPGRGHGQALSPDGKWASRSSARSPTRSSSLYPTGAGEPKVFRRRAHVCGASSCRTESDFFAGREPGHGSPDSTLQAVAGGKPRAVTPEGYRGRTRLAGRQAVDRARARPKASTSIRSAAAASRRRSRARRERWAAAWARTASLRRERATARGPGADRLVIRDR